MGYDGNPQQGFGRPAPGVMAYLDHAATTPMVPEAIEIMTAELGQLGNPSSLHNAGRRARRVVEESREQIAAALGARPSEVIFTSGGTEADNLAVKGLFWAMRAARPRRRRVLVSSVEHHAVIDSAQWLAEHGEAEVCWLDVDARGRVQPEVLRAAIERDPGDVALVSIMLANNEVGTVQPVAELAAICHEHGLVFHTDAVQAVGQLPVDFGSTGADALTITGHKIGGPVGAGATPAIAAFATAVQLAVESRAEYAKHVAGLREDLIRQVLAAVPDAILNGDDPGPGRLPGNAHFSFPGCEGDALLMLLDAKGIACSTGSACTAGVAQPSHVLVAMGADVARARGSLRFSLGHTSTQADVDAVGTVIGEAVERARRAAAR